MIIALSLAAGPALADTAPDAWCSLMLGRYVTEADAAATEDPPVPLPLQRARYEIDILGNLAVGSLTVEFTNPATEPADARYLSHRPSGTVVESVLASIGDSDEWTELGVAEAASKPARGRTRRSQPSRTPRVTSLAVPAGETVTVVQKLRRTVSFTDNRFELVLPAVGGDCSDVVEGWPDGGLVVPPLEVELHVQHTAPLGLAESPSHEIAVAFENDHNTVEVVSGPLGDLPFVFEYSLGGEDAPMLSAFAAPPTDDGVREVMIVLAPAVDSPSESIRPKEALFVLDTSGSMRDGKIAEAVKALGSCLEKVTPDDRFNIVEFDAEFSLLFEEPDSGTTETMDRARQWLAGLRTGGGTSLLPALSSAFEQPRDEALHRLVIVLTDGKLGDAREVESFLEEQLDDARLFIVGIGEDANEQGIVRLAELGRGTAVFAKNAEQLADAVTGLFAGIASPVAWDLEVLWGGAEVLSIEPRRVPDLYAGRPVTIKARVRGELPAELLVEASTMDGIRVFQTALPAGGAREYDEVGRGGR